MTGPELQQTWRQLALSGEERRSESDEAGAVDAIRRAIAAKATRADSTITLVLDATDSPRYAFTAVVGAFRAGHGAWAKRVGFRAIYVVGPVEGAVNRLDVDV